MIKRVRADKAIDEFYAPYAAAKGGKECAENLFNTRGNIFLEPQTAPISYTPEQLAKAKETMRRITEERKKAALHALS